MSELLIATNKWLECCGDIKSLKLQLQKDPSRTDRKIELQELEKREPKLKAELDRLKSICIKENLEKPYRDCGAGQG
ncbi:hypothetical protein [Methanobacterium spitsbergense]|uniref:Uncharacterized protein n=1 Tax=Methanobacterium spitsbergense TaxID=2874285 RepID=A0A8T5UQU2_9EURY|nr:hypothetical protein [Methanobacterium spitsbergense]MBZ2166352.1 hypothetical protein [Methanobacterium spitsbergense]